MKNYYANNFKNVYLYWSTCLGNVCMKEHFVSLKIEKDNVCKRESGMLINDYKSLFEDAASSVIFKTIVIEGDAGCGKTTYVNKLTLDWVENDAYLHSQFDLLFNFPLAELETSVQSSIQTFVPEEFLSYIDVALNEYNSRVLFIFDGFDELSETHACYEEVLPILNRFRFCHVTVLVTCRLSITNLVQQQPLQNWLQIKGFDDESLSRYLKNEGYAENFVDVLPKDVFNLLHLPLFAALFCLLHYSLEDATCSLTLFDVVDNFVDSVVNIAIRKLPNSKETIDKDIKKISTFATSKLDKYSFLSIYPYFCCAQDVWNNSNEAGSGKTDLNNVVINLLIKEKVPTGIYNKFRVGFSFPHLLVAQCLASRLVLNAVLDELQKMDPFEESDEGFVIMTPLTQFFANGFLKKWLNGELLIENVIQKQYFQSLYYYWFSKLRDAKLFSKLSKVKAIAFLDSDNIGKSVSFFKNLSKCSNLTEMCLPNCSISMESLKLLADAMKRNEFQLLEILDFH